MSVCFSAIRQNGYFLVMPRIASVNLPPYKFHRFIVNGSVHPSVGGQNIEGNLSLSLFWPVDDCAGVALTSLLVFLLRKFDQYVQTDIRIDKMVGGRKDGRT